MKKLLMAAAAVAVMPVAANAAVVVTSTSATNPYSGPTPTYDFDTSVAPIVGGSIVSAENGIHLRPFGSTGNFLSVGPTDGNPAVLSLASFGSVGAISFLWGSMDIFNTIEFLDSLGNVIYSANGEQFKNPGAAQPGNVNRVVTFTFTDGTAAQVKSARFSSSADAFEIDNIAVRAVPEPATWMMMILGFFGLSFAIRRRGATSAPRVRFA